MAAWLGVHSRKSILGQAISGIRDLVVSVVKDQIRKPASIVERLDEKPTGHEGGSKERRRMILASSVSPLGRLAMQGSARPTQRSPTQLARSGPLDKIKMSHRNDEEHVAGQDGEELAAPTGGCPRIPRVSVIGSFPRPSREHSCRYPRTKQ